MYIYINYNYNHEPSLVCYHVLYCVYRYILTYYTHQQMKGKKTQNSLSDSWQKLFNTFLTPVCLPAHWSCETEIKEVVRLFISSASSDTHMNTNRL